MFGQGNRLILLIDICKGAVKLGPPLPLTAKVGTGLLKKVRQISFSNRRPLTTFKQNQCTWKNGEFFVDLYDTMI